jgi:hypothetical protein
VIPYLRKRLVSVMVFFWCGRECCSRGWEIVLSPWINIECVVDVDVVRRKKKGRKAGRDAAHPRFLLHQMRVEHRLLEAKVISVDIARPVMMIRLGEERRAEWIVCFLRILRHKTARVRVDVRVFVCVCI